MSIHKFIQKIQKTNYFPKSSKWIFLLLLVIISIIYNYQEVLFKPTQSLHQWRQCDSLSITWNYYQDQNSFLEPSVHYLGDDGTGKTASDFPLIYYFVALLWKIFGPYEFIYRIVVLLLFFIGLFALFKIFENTLKDSILAIICPLLLFTSPTLVYFANNFLMDMPAFSFALIGLYYFFKFWATSKNKHLYLFILFNLIGGLLKISSLMSFMAIMGIFVLEYFNVKLVTQRKIFQQPYKQILPLMTVFIAQIIWYVYASSYNSNYNSGIFLIGYLPIWDFNMLEIKETLHAIKNHIQWDYFRTITQIIFLIMISTILFFHKKMNKILLSLTIFLFIGIILFATLFFQALKDHDYYTINLFIIIPIIILSFLHLLKQHYQHIYSSLILKILLVTLLIHNIDFARRRLDGRYSNDGWANKEYVEHLQHFTTISPYLETIEVDENDRVICLSDNSINISLYLMKHKGWTNYGLNLEPSKIKEKIKLGAKYLFIYDEQTLKNKNLRPFLTQIIGEYNGIKIFRL